MTLLVFAPSFIESGSLDRPKAASSYHLSLRIFKFLFDSVHHAHITTPELLAIRWFLVSRSFTQWTGSFILAKALLLPFLQVL